MVAASRAATIANLDKTAAASTSLTNAPKWCIVSPLQLID
jgi:hypothetical protein